MTTAPAATAPTRIAADTPARPVLAAAGANRVVGVIGHVDHGKTALVRALTGMETDRLEEEKRRGISIALGFAHLACPGGASVDLVDMPGHERFVRTMIAGATGIDAVLLVVAADGGVQPQTVEHVEIASLLGITDAVLAVTRADRADAPLIAASTAAARALLDANNLALRAAHVVSAVTGDGIAALADALAALPAAGPRNGADDDGWCFLPVDRAFTIAGAGTVVTGTLRRGPVRDGDELTLLAPGTLAADAPRPLRVRSVQTHGTRVARGAPGTRTALNLRGIEPDRLPRGTVLATPDILLPARRLAVSLRATASAPALATGARLLLLAGTDEVEVRLRLLDRDTLQPGARGFAELVARRAVALPARERFVLRLASPAATVAGGAVLETGESRLKRHHPPTLARLAARDGATPRAIVADALARAGASGTTLAVLGRSAGLAPARAASLLDPTAVIARRGGAVIARAHWDTLLRRLPSLVAHGTRPDTVAAPLLEEAIAHLVRQGSLARDGSRLLVPDAARDAAKRDTEDTVARALAAILRKAGLAPPPVTDIAPDPPTRRVLDRLVRAGVLVLASDRVQKRDWAFHADAIADATARLGEALGHASGGLLVGEIGALLGVTRRHAVPLLEHLDATGVTRRIGDRRVRAAE